MSGHPGAAQRAPLMGAPSEGGAYCEVCNGNDCAGANPPMMDCPAALASKEKPLRAYSVQADEYGCIRFATSGAQARRQGANEMDIEWEDIISCRRAPQFDHFAPGPVSDAALWEAGWSFYCEVCDCHVKKDYDGRLVKGRFYCSEHAALSDGAGHGTASTSDQGCSSRDEPLKAKEAGQ